MRRCPVCGESNPNRARFCLSCGSPLGAPEPVLPEERRLVTVLFCDLVGFTERADRADPEEVKGTLRPFHARVQREIEGYGGWVAGFFGDGVLAIFGAPIAHEDDPERAVLAGLRIQEAIEELNRENPALALTARIGIETGEAVVALAPGPQIGGDVTGDVTNTASRLQGVAPPGGIVVGETTYRATSTEFRFRELEPVTVKGKTGALRIWQPLAPAARLPEDARRRFTTPLVGRTEELATLERLLLRTIRDGVPGFGLLTGEAGVGKTRLVNELAAIADRVPELVRWRQGRPLPYGVGVAFSALAEVVKAEAAILESDTADAARAKLATALERVVPDPAEREALASALDPLLGITDPSVAEDDGGEGWTGWGALDAGRSEIFARWRRFLELLATDNPLVLVFEDLHHASDPFLDFVDDLLDWSAGLPMLVLAVGRPELLQRRPQWADWAATTHLHVAPLPGRDTHELVDLLLRDMTLPPETVDLVVRRAEGIPLYAEEFAGLLHERGQTLGPDEETEVPLTLRALIAARLDGLPPDERALLQDAAVVGRTFWSGALAAVAGVEPGRLDPVLAALVERRLVRRARASTVAGEQEFAFSHALVRDVAYARIPRRVRAGKHRAVAGWIERVAGDRIGDRAEALALHYGQALVLSRAAGDEEAAAELLDPTVRYVRLAAERAMGFDAQQGHRLYTRALALLPEGHPERALTLRDAGGTATALGHFDEAERFLRRALDEYQRVDDQTGRADILVAFSRLSLERGDTESVGPLLDVALGLLEGHESGPPLAAAYARHAGYLFLVGDYEGSLRRARQGLALARELEMGREEVLALNYLGGAQGALGDPAGIDVLREAVRRGLDLGLGPETAIAMNNLAEELRFLESPASSLEVWEEMVSLTRERALSSSLAWARMGEGSTRFDLGHWDEVLAIESEAEAWDRAHGVSPFGTHMRLIAGWVALRRGDFDGVAARMRDILPRAQRIGYAEYEAPAYVQLAEFALVRGRDAEARSMLEAFARASSSDRLWRTTLLPVVVRILARLGDLDRARELVTDPPPAMSERERLSLASARAVLAEGEGDLEHAAVACREAADEWRAYGMPIEVGQLLVGLTRCEMALGHREAARAAAQEAVDVLRPLGARPLIDEAERLVGALDA